MCESLFWPALCGAVRRRVQGRRTRIGTLPHCLITVIKACDFNGLSRTGPPYLPTT